MHLWTWTCPWHWPAVLQHCLQPYNLQRPFGNPIMHLKLTGCLRFIHGLWCINVGAPIVCQGAKQRNEYALRLSPSVLLDKVAWLCKLQIGDESLGWSGLNLRLQIWGYPLSRLELIGCAILTKMHVWSDAIRSWWHSDVKSGRCVASSEYLHCMGCWQRCLRAMDPGTHPMLDTFQC